MSNATNVAFSEAVKAAQERKGSRKGYARMAMHDRITPDLKDFIEARSSAYLASASADGQPYVQHRGGPPGFLKVLDERRIAFADFKGNRQFISTGNFDENPKAFLFLMDYAHRRRIKLWGTVKVIADEPNLVAQWMPDGYRARPEQAMVFEVLAWDANCPQHIPVLLPAEEVEAALDERDARIAELQADLAALKVEGRG